MTLPIPQWTMLKVPHIHIHTIIEKHKLNPDLFGTSLENAEPLLVSTKKRPQKHLKQDTLYRANHEGKIRIFKISDIESNVYEMTECKIDGTPIKNGVVEFAEELRFFGKFKAVISE